MPQVIFWTKYDVIFLIFYGFERNFQGSILMPYGHKKCKFHPNQSINTQSFNPYI